TPAPPPAEKSVPAPPTPTSAPTQAVDDEAMAALLLSLPEDDPGETKIRGVDSQGIPTGSTVMDLPAPALAEEEVKPEPVGKKPPTARGSGGDTAAAAASLLKKYQRRGKQ